jgi:hypothetical protein
VTGIARAQLIAADDLTIKLALARYFDSRGDDYWAQPISGSYDGVWLGSTGRPTFLFHAGTIYLYGLRPKLGVIETLIRGALVRHRTYSATGAVLDTTYVGRGDNRWN